MSVEAKKPASPFEAFAAEAASLADKMRAKAETLGAGDLEARGACYAVPMQPWRPGLDHVSFWPGKLEDFKPGDRIDDLAIAVAYLLLALERRDRETQARAA